jgi:Fic family protein
LIRRSIQEITMTVPQDIVERVRSEYLEMPGLRLTAEQARRLWSLDLSTCRSLLDALVEANFLRRSGDGNYSRRSYT